MGFASPDTIIPDPGNTLDYNRYGYARYNPLKYTDPTGHFCYDANTNEFTEGSCSDDMQQLLLEGFVTQLESGDYSDLELMENLINHTLSMNNNPVIALRAASEIVRRSTPSGFGWSYSAGSDFYYESYTNDRFDDSGFGDLADTETANQIAHFTGIAYIAAYQSRETISINTDVLVWGQEAKNLGKQSMKQSQIDRDLGYLAVDFAESLTASYVDLGYLGPQERQWLLATSVHSAVSSIQSYNYASQHPITNWWLSR